MKRANLLIGVAVCISLSLVLSVSCISPVQESTTSQPQQNHYQWTQDVFDEAMGKLEEGHEFRYDSSSARPFDLVVPLPDHPVLFLDPDLNETLVFSEGSIKGKLIIAESDFTSPGALVPLYYEESDGKLDFSRAAYRPVSQVYVGDLPFDEGRYASSVEECDTLAVIAINKYVSKAYYNDGADKVEVRTYVFLIDAKNKEVTHVHFVGIDEPGDAVANDGNIGKALHEEALEYIASLNVAA